MDLMEFTEYVVTTRFEAFERGEQPPDVITLTASEYDSLCDDVFSKELAPYRNAGYTSNPYKGPFTFMGIEIRRFPPQ